MILDNDLKIFWDQEHFEAILKKLSYFDKFQEYVELVSLLTYNQKGMMVQYLLSDFSNSIELERLEFGGFENPEFYGWREQQLKRIKFSGEILFFDSALTGGFYLRILVKDVAKFCFDFVKDQNWSFSIFSLQTQEAYFITDDGEWDDLFLYKKSDDLVPENFFEVYNFQTKTVLIEGKENT
jgi:hypothetical protein